MGILFSHTLATLSWQPDGQSSSSTANNQQPTSLGQHPHSVGSISSVRSPPANINKPLQNSPLRRPSSGPMFEHELKQEGEAEGIKTHSAPSSVSEGVRKISIHSQASSNNSKLQSGRWKVFYLVVMSIVLSQFDNLF